jgi:hypothetical protein
MDQQREREPRRGEERPRPDRDRPGDRYEYEGALASGAPEAEPAAPGADAEERERKNLGRRTGGGSG